MTETKITPRFKTKYAEVVVPALQEEFKYENVMQIPGLTKVVTIEASGIAPALYVAEALELPMIFAKKAKNITMNEGILTAEVYSFTKQVTSTVSIASKFLTPDTMRLFNMKRSTGFFSKSTNRWSTMNKSATSCCWKSLTMRWTQCAK